MDILFITPTEELDIRLESNGTMLLATKLLQDGFQVKLLRFGEEKNYNKKYHAFVSGMVKRVLKERPACVSFYTVWPSYHVMLRIAQQIKEKAPQITVVFGGPQSSATARATMEAMPFVDYICIGEGENTVVPFFRALLRQQGEGMEDVPGLYYRKDGQIVHNNMETPLCDLNTLPHWDDSLYVGQYEVPACQLNSRNYFMPIDAGRGCPYNCTFCCTSHFWKRTYRLKTPERIIEDILFYNQKFGIHSFWFSHDAFTTNKKLVEAVCDRMLEQGLDIRWKCTTRIDCITEDLILKMKEAGMIQIEVGIETGSIRMQKLTNKNLKLDVAKSKIDFMLKNGIRVDLFFMYGFPEETEEDLQDTLRLLFELLDMGVHHVSMAFCRFNPATQITEDHFDELVLDRDIKVLTRGVFGCEDEEKMIAENKAIFPFFYHLDTPVRKKYQYLIFFTYLYELFPNAIRHLRKLYNGDDLAFYHAFCSCNAECFAGDMNHATECIRQQPVEMIERMVDSHDIAYGVQLKGLLRYDYDMRRLRHIPDDLDITKTYDFVILDYQRKLPVEQYAPGRTTLRIVKRKMNIRTEILDIQ